MGKIVEKCPICKENFLKSKWSKRICCSVPCSYIYRSLKYRGENSHLYEGKLKERRCPVCNKVFTAYLHVKTCSVECGQEIRSQKIRGMQYPSRKKKYKRKCPVCGEKFSVHLSKKNQFLCSLECRIKWMRLTRKREGNPNWKGGPACRDTTPYSRDFSINRKKVLIRDDFTCQLCLDEGWIVHHIDYDKEYSHPSNLVTVCDSCHAITNGNRKFWIWWFKGGVSKMPRFKPIVIKRYAWLLNYENKFKLHSTQLRNALDAVYA